MLVVKNSQLNESVIVVLNKLMEMDMNPVAAFKLTRAMREISTIVEDKTIIEKKIVDKYATKNDDGSYLEVTNESGEVVSGAIKISDMESFTKEMNELMEVEHTLNIDKIEFEKLELSSPLKPMDLINLDFIFS